MSAQPAVRRVLAVDIGGTKTIVALFAVGAAGLHPLRETTYASREHADFVQILEAFAPGAEGGPPWAACFDVAGVVVDGRCRPTNLPWQLDEGALARALGTPRVKLINDLEATALGMLQLAPAALAELNPGARPARPGHVAVIAAGTGLGEAMLYWDGTLHHPMASEGGHADFAPRGELQIELLRHLAAQGTGHVSWERALSGPGLHEIYLFLRERGAAAQGEWLAGALESGDPSAAISRAALEHGDALANQALDLLCEIYGAEAGNMALRGLTTGGVYLGGGIAAKILPALRRGGFLRAFADKGRFADLLRGIAVRVALEPRAALLGAAHLACRL